MSVVVITPPEPVVSLDQAKRQARLVGIDDFDQQLVDLIATAQGTIDGPGGWLGRAIGLQTLELRLDSFYSQDWRWGRDWREWGSDAEWRGWSNPRRFGRIELPYPPFVAVTSIIYEDQNGVDQTLTADGWNATDEGLTPAFGDVWPSGRITADALRIQYQAGYATPPMPVQHAILLLVSHWFNHPDAVVGVENRDSSAEMPIGVTSLLSPFRVWS